MFPRQYVRRDLAHSVLEEIKDIEYNLNTSGALQFSLTKDLITIDAVIDSFTPNKDKVLIIRSIKDCINILTMSKDKFI